MPKQRKAVTKESSGGINHAELERNWHITRGRIMHEHGITLEHAELGQQMDWWGYTLKNAKGGARQQEVGRTSPGRSGKLKKKQKKDEGDAERISIAEVRERLVDLRRRYPRITYTDACRRVAAKVGYKSHESVRMYTKDLQWRRGQT